MVEVTLVTRSSIDVAVIPLQMVFRLRVREKHSAVQRKGCEWRSMLCPRRDRTLNADRIRERRAAGGSDGEIGVLVELVGIEPQLALS
jgi:hypothetical protein